MASVPTVNRDNLRIARENIGLSTTAATKQISASRKDLVAEWEVGTSTPSWSQISKLAKTYNISELLFFSNNAIERHRTVPDFRVSPHEGSDARVQKLVNLVMTRQAWLERRFKEAGYAKNALQGSGKNAKTPQALARFIAEKLDIDLSEIKRLSSREKALNYLVERAEANGIFVGKTVSYHRLEVNDLRGLFVSNDYCPFIVLNRRDALSAQIFSFVHELAHFFRKTDAISNSLSFRSSDKQVNPEEILCNQVAANLLLPDEAFKENSYGKKEIEAMSDAYKVSELFIFYRLKDLGKISKETQQYLETQIKKEMEENLRIKREKDDARSGGNHVNNMKDSNGDLFNRVVNNSYLDNKINYVEASRLLRFTPDQV